MKKISRFCLFSFSLVLICGLCACAPDIEKPGKRSFVFIIRPAIFRNHQSTGGKFSFQPAGKYTV